MTIAIIGAGAMGSLFGGRLSLAGEDVWLLDIWEDHVQTIQDSGLTIMTADGELIAHPRATTRASDIGPTDLVIVFVKSTMTKAAARIAAALLTGNTPVLTLQNGYGNAEELAEVVGAQRIIAGTTAQGATMLGPGRVFHAGNGETHIGLLTGGVNSCLQTVADLLCRADIPTVATTDLAPFIWGKLVVNAGINALTAITGLSNGQLADYQGTTSILKLAVGEAVAVAKASGVELPYPDPVGQVLSVATATAPNRSSMLQDLDHCRMTEIDAINGAIVREGTRLGVATPVNQVLTLLIKSIEQIKQENRR